MTIPCSNVDANEENDEENLTGVAFFHGPAESSRMTMEDSQSRSSSSSTRTASTAATGFCQHGAFFLGALFGTIAALSDLRDALRYSSSSSSSSSSSDEEEMSSEENPIRNPWKFWTFYKYLSVTSTLLYLLDSLLHGCEDYQDTRWIFPLLFGSAASMDLLSCLLEDDDRPMPSIVVGSIAVHLFLLSAIMTLYDNHRYYWMIVKHSSIAGMFVGDLLFLAGSVIDVCISYWETPGSTQLGWVQVASWGLVSSLLWLIDSLIYRWADVAMFEDPDIVWEEEEQETELDTTDDSDIVVADDETANESVPFVVSLDS